MTAETTTERGTSARDGVASQGIEIVNPTVRAFKREATEDPEGFWARAAQRLPWFKPWERVLDWTPPTFR